MLLFMSRFREIKLTYWVTPDEQKQLKWCALQNKESKSGLIRRLISEEYMRIQVIENDKKINKGLTVDKDL